MQLHERGCEGQDRETPQSNLGCQRAHPKTIQNPRPNKSGEHRAESQENFPAIFTQDWYIPAHSESLSKREVGP